MTEHEEPATGSGPGGHPVRDALLDLLRQDGMVTATSAAARLGGSSGLYSFHLRRLAQFGMVEEAPARRGRVRPWLLADRGAAEPGTGPAAAPAQAPGTVTDAQISDMARGLEDESYRRWQQQRASAPRQWRRDEVFSQVVYLTPQEMTGMANVIRALIAQYQHREATPAARPAGAAPVAVVSRLFPLLGLGAPDADAPGSAVPGADAPDADAPGSAAPDTAAPDADAPDTAAPDTGEPSAFRGLPWSEPASPELRCRVA